MSEKATTPAAKETRYKFKNGGKVANIPGWGEITEAHLQNPNILAAIKKQDQKKKTDWFDKLIEKA